MRDRDQPSSFDDSPADEKFPIRRVALFCDRGCGAVFPVEVRADTAVEAYGVLRRVAVEEMGWVVTGTEDVCPACDPSVSPNPVRVPS